MPRQADHIEQPGAATAERQESTTTEAPKTDSLTDYASGVGNQEFSNTVARQPAETADVKPGDTAPAENEAPEAETQEVKPDEGAAAAEPAATPEGAESAAPATEAGAAEGGESATPESETEN